MVELTGDTTIIIPDVTLAAGSTSVKASAGTTLTATVTDQFGYAIASQTVTFSFTTNNSGGSLSKTSVVTNTSGQAVVNYMAGTTSGANDTVTATVGGSSDSVVISVTP
jgi:adhesin/invasin